MLLSCAHNELLLFDIKTLKWWWILWILIIQTWSFWPIKLWLDPCNAFSYSTFLYMTISSVRHCAERVPVSSIFKTSARLYPSDMCWWRLYIKCNYILLCQFRKILNSFLFDDRMTSFLQFNVWIFRALFCLHQTIEHNWLHHYWILIKNEYLVHDNTGFDIL